MVKHIRPIYNKIYIDFLFSKDTIIYDELELRLDDIPCKVGAQNIKIMKKQNLFHFVGILLKDLVGLQMKQIAENNNV